MSGAFSEEFHTRDLELAVDYQVENRLRRPRLLFRRGGPGIGQETLAGERHGRKRAPADLVVGRQSLVAEERVGVRTRLEHQEPHLQTGAQREGKKA